MNHPWRLILKLAGAVLAVAGVVCVVVGYWDTICASIGAVKDILAEKRKARLSAYEYEDYDDEEMEQF